MRRASYGCLFALACCAGQAGAATAPVGIVAPNGESTIAFDMNAAGQVAAVLEDEDGRHRGVLFEKGVLTELALIQGGHSDTKAINADGEIVGSAQGKDGHWHAYLYNREHGMRELGALGGPSSYGMAINRVGQVVGFADTNDTDFHAFLFNGRSMLDLGTLGGKVSFASGMNNVGQVVGTSAQSENYRHAFVYDATRGMVDLGTLGGRSSSATAINDAGVIVGASETTDHKWHAFVHDGKRMVDLGTLIGAGSSFATSINSAGDVVGTVLIGDEHRTFVWKDGVMKVHRGGKGLYLTNNINDNGQVIGATYSHRLQAATMPSNSIVEVERTPQSRFVPKVLLSLLVAAAAVILRRRFRGIAMPAAAA
jgi:probable HAF family extracellular repeat protein